MKVSVELITILLFYCSSKVISQSPPNIFLILADDLGYDDLSHRGSNEFLTPNIDALGYHGKILKNFYSAPMCTPTRAALLSGKYPIRMGLQHEVIRNPEDRSLPLDIVTLPELLQKAGYATNLVGKWHLGLARKEYTPTYRGFDHHFGHWGSYIDYYTRTCQTEGENISYGYDFHRDMELNCEHPNRYITDLYTDEAERIISAHKGSSKPLFLMLSHAAPHSANDEELLQAPDEVIDKFSYIKDKDRRTYAAMVHKLDESIGRVIQAIDQAGMLNNSIIIFSSDNGAPSVESLANSGSNWPMRGQKASPWEAAVHVGAVIWSTLIDNRSSIFEQPIHVSDWFPTLIKAAGSQLAEDLELDGVDIWDQLTAQRSEQYKERDMLHQLDDIFKVVSYMHGPWKYISGTTKNGSFDSVLKFRELKDISTQNYTHEVLNSLASLSLQKFDEKKLTAQSISELRSKAGVTCEGTVRRECNALFEECLYNINEDPCEQNNLSHLSEYQELLADMRARIEKYRQISVPPTNTGGSYSNHPIYHRCQWSNFAEEAPSQIRSTCNSDAYKLYCPVHF